jgi:predicted Zn-dependent peptidase
MFPDRSTAPAFKTIESFDLPVLSKLVLNNGIPLYYYNGGSSEVLKLEIFLENGGQSSEFVPAQSNLAIRMLTEGTSSRSSEQIQEEIARSGGFIELNPGSDRSSIVLYSLSRQLPNLLPVVIDLINHSIFPDKELENLRNISIQSLKVNLEKTGYLASSTFRELIFGKGHPYGFNLTLESLASVSREDLLAFYSKFKSGNFTVFLSGKFDDSIVKTLQQNLESIPTQHQNEPALIAANGLKPHERVVVEKTGNMQCSLRVGRRLFTSSHPDYFSFVVMNEILGGYFGSRLMQNLREEKGLTYGVHSNVVGYKTDGYFVIGTDIKKSDAQQALDEIQKEIKRMQVEPVSEDELQTVKNYMLGSFVNTLTTPFAIVDKSKSILLNNLSGDFYQRYFSSVKNATPQQLMDVASKYLQAEDLVEVVGGSLEG